MLSVVLGGEGLVGLGVRVVRVLPSVRVFPGVSVLPGGGVGVEGVVRLAGFLVLVVVEGLGSGVAVVVESLRGVVGENLRGVVVVVENLRLGVGVLRVRLEEHVRQDVAQCASGEESYGSGDVSELHDGGVVR